MSSGNCRRAEIPPAPEPGNGPNAQRWREMRGPVDDGLVGREQVGGALAPRARALVSLARTSKGLDVVVLDLEADGDRVQAVLGPGVAVVLARALTTATELIRARQHARQAGAPAPTETAREPELRDGRSPCPPRRSAVKSP